MNRRGFFRRVLATAVTAAATSYLPLRKIVPVAALSFQGIPIRCDGPMTATEIGMRRDEEMLRLDGKLVEIDKLYDRLVDSMLNPPLVDGIRKPAFYASPEAFAMVEELRKSDRGW